MITPKEQQAITDRIAELESQKDNLSMELEEFKNKLQLRKNEISAELRVLKRKVAWYKYAASHYESKDYSTSPAMQLFGKRAKDLTPEEKKEYNRLMTQKSRQNRRTNNENHSRN